MLLFTNHNGRVFGLGILGASTTDAASGKDERFMQTQRLSTRTKLPSHVGHASRHMTCLAFDLAPPTAGFANRHALLSLEPHHIFNRFCQHRRTSFGFWCFKGIFGLAYFLSKSLPLHPLLADLPTPPESDPRAKRKHFFPKKKTCVNLARVLLITFYCFLRSNLTGMVHPCSMFHFPPEILL